MRRRFFSLAVCAMMLFCLCGCAKSRLSAFADEEALLTVDGQPILTALDFRRLRTQQAVSHDILDTDLPREKAAFITQAEIALLSCFAEEYGLSYDRTAVEQEYDAHLLEIQDTDLYGKELLFSTALQAALGMDADAYRTWSVDEACKDYDIQELLDDIASLYSHISDAETLRELLQQNLLHLLEIHEVEIRYPGVSLRKLTFEDILLEN